MSGYRNVLLEIGKSQEEIDERVEKTFQEIFYGPDKFFFTTEDGKMGYLVDTGNNDTRTEGISYGMMICVQLDKKKEFDQLWTWAKTNMYLEDGENKGYFAWSVHTDGSKNSNGPAPDGEEYFAMALFFASHRWGDGEGIFDYSGQARSLLRDCIHHEELYGGHNMWTDDGLIKFVPGLEFTDPSYHLPHFYELFSRWANEEDRDFWKKAAQASREYLTKACHPLTGFSPEYSHYDGRPYPDHEYFGGRHDWFYSDSYRTIANLGLNYSWCMADKTLQGAGGKDFLEWSQGMANKYQTFFAVLPEKHRYRIYEIDGTVLEADALHPVGLKATIAQASLVTDCKYAKDAVEEFWNTPLRTGERRYYDNCLYMFAMLALSGKYKII